MPALQTSANLNAWITTLGFAWLVGPMELQESEVEIKGELQKWKSKVLIKKCRYLEASGCIGMCTNMCQAGSLLCQSAGVQLKVLHSTVAELRLPASATHTDLLRECSGPAADDDAQL